MKTVGWIALAALLLIGGITGRGFLGYVAGYQSHHWNPASGIGGPVSYYYIDWRQDWSSLDELREATQDGPLRTRLAREIDGEIRYDPIAVIQGGLALHDQLLDSPSAEREAILERQIEWLEQEGIVWLESGIPVWPCYWEAEGYGMTEPWISAMTQGQAISLLVREAHRTGNPRHLEIAARATRAFLEPGLPIVWRSPEGEVFFEEYPTVPPSHVLNGALCAWLGLWDFVRATGDPEVRRFCESSLASISRVIPEYEIGDWTRYDVLQSRRTSPNYQEIHAALAESIAEISRDPVWADRAKRWRAASEDKMLRVEVFFSVLGAKIRNATGVAAVPVKPVSFPELERSLNRDS